MAKPVADITHYIKIYLKNNISFFPLFPSTKIPIVAHEPYYERLPTKEEIKEWLRIYLNPKFWEKLWNTEDEKLPEHFRTLKRRWIDALKREFAKIGRDISEYKYEGEVNIAVAGGYNNLVLIDIEDASKVTANPVNFFSQLFPIIVKTGKEHGYHLWALCSEWNQNVVGSNGEIRARRQYVAAPPSRHPNGSYYHFVHPKDLKDFRLDSVSKAFIESEVLKWIEADRGKKEKTGRKKELWNEIKGGAKKLEVKHGCRSDWTFALTVLAKAVFDDEEEAFKEIIEIPIVYSKCTRDGRWDYDKAFEWWKKYEWDTVGRSSVLSSLYALRWAERTTNMKLPVNYEEKIKEYMSVTRTKGYAHMLSEEEIITEIVSVLEQCVRTEETKDGGVKYDVRKDYIMFIAEELNKMFYFVTIEELDELYIYDSGVYKPGEPRIKRWLQIAWSRSTIRLKKPLNTHIVNEIINALKRLNYKPLRIFYEPKDYINLKNGLFNIKEWRLEPHRPEVYFLTQVNAEYDENAKSELWERFLREVTTEKQAKYLQEFIGYCLLQDCRFEKALAIVGPGGSGKSTFLDAVRYMIGYDNTTAFSIQQLEHEQFTCAELLGKLVNIYNDLPYSTLAKSDVFKQLVSGDPIKIERKYKQPFTARLYCKLIFAANQLPETIDETSAFFRRWIIVTFPKPVEKPDPNLKRKLREHTNAIFIWALEGLKRILENGGFSYKFSPDEVADIYKKVADPVYVFCEKCLVEDPTGSIQASKLYSYFLDFCEKTNSPTVSQREFSIRIMRYMRNITKTRKSDGIYYRGIRYIGYEESEEQGREEEEVKTKESKDKSVDESEEILKENFVIDDRGFGAVTYICRKCNSVFFDKEEAFKHIEEGCEEAETKEMEETEIKEIEVDMTKETEEAEAKTKEGEDSFEKRPLEQEELGKIDPEVRKNYEIWKEGMVVFFECKRCGSVFLSEEDAKSHLEARRRDPSSCPAKRG